MGGCESRDKDDFDSPLPAKGAPAAKGANGNATNGEEPRDSALMVSALLGARLSPQELELLGAYNEVVERGKAKKKSYKKHGGEVYLCWCDGRSGQKYSEAWWFSRKIDAADCIAFCSIRETEDALSSPPPANGWQGPPRYFFQAPTVIPIRVHMKGPPPPSIADVVVRVKACGEGCLGFIKDVQDAMKQQRSKAKDASANAEKMEVSSTKEDLMIQRPNSTVPDQSPGSKSESIEVVAKSKAAAPPPSLQGASPETLPRSATNLAQTTEATSNVAEAKKGDE